ncbi:hypothetical protein [Algiphilus sp.]|uniref:hypothetical protein n=1 Tax=Algiphilus sp. TaxID=1872431 RepID=UPI003B521567
MNAEHMTPDHRSVLQRRLDAMHEQLQQIDGKDAAWLRRSADECRRLARECQQPRTTEGDALADRFESLAVDISMELDERTVSALLSGHGSD